MSSGKRINRDTRISELLKVDQEGVISALVKLNKNFSKLKNPLLRNLFARRVTIADACRIANCPANLFFDSMRSLGFEIGYDSPPHNKGEESIDFDLSSGKIVEFDVRPILAGGTDPLKMILKKTQGLEPGQTLKLINSFEPIPLIHLLKEKGFRHLSQNPHKDVFVTYFQVAKQTAEQEPKRVKNHREKDFDVILSRFREENLVRIDVRNLEMPGPMLTILENLDKLMPHQALFVLHKKIPVYLLPELESRGFEYVLTELGEKGVNMLIYKP